MATETTEVKDLPSGNYFCLTCNEDRTEAEVILVPRDEFHNAVFRGCRVCNNRCVWKEIVAERTVLSPTESL